VDDEKDGGKVVIIFFLRLFLNFYIETRLLRKSFYLYKNSVPVYSTIIKKYSCHSVKFEHISLEYTSLEVEK